MTFPHYERFVPAHLRDEWHKHLYLSLAVEVFGYFLAPIACIFVTTEPRRDRVKRLDKKTLTMSREYLIPFFRWLQTHDNAVDEWYWGMFAKEGSYGYDWTPQQYLSSWWKRYYSRVAWVWRNMAYTYQYETLGVVKEDKPYKTFEEGTDNKEGGYIRIEVYQHYFRYEYQKDLGNGTYKKYQFGHKHHRSAPISKTTGKINAMYANKIIDFNASEYKD